jgi:hypothetical protein
MIERIEDIIYPKFKQEVLQIFTSDTIQFFTENVDGETYGVSITIKKLVEDWYGDCNTCPTNGERIHCVVFYQDGKAYPLLGNIDFDFLMRVLEQI